MLRNTRDLGDIVNLDNNRRIIAEQLAEATANKIIYSTDLAVRVLQADPYIQKQIAVLFQKPYYDVILDDLPKNKTLWKSPSYISAGDFFVILQYMYEYDRLKFINNIGHEHIYHLQDPWQIKSVAKFLPSEDERHFLHSRYLKSKFTLQDLLGIFDDLNQPFEEQWKLVQNYLGVERAREILTILDNNTLPGQGDKPIAYCVDPILLKTKVVDPVALQALKCKRTDQLVPLLKNKSALQQRVIVELFGGPKEIKRALDQENRSRGFTAQNAPKYISYGKLIKSLPIDTQFDLLGFPKTEDANKNEPNVLQRDRNAKPMVGQFNRFLEHSGDMMPTAVIDNVKPDKAVQNRLSGSAIKAKL